MANHSALCRSIKYDYMNILTWTILKKTQIVNGCETFAFKYMCFNAISENKIIAKIPYLQYRVILANDAMTVAWYFQMEST